MIKLSCSPIYKYGQKVYIIEPDPVNRFSSKTFTEKCPVCEGEHKITIKGYTADCPFCNGVRTLTNNSVTVKKYVLREYYVYELRLTGPEYISQIKNGKPDIRTYKAFTRWSNGYDGVKERELPLYKNKIDPEPSLFSKTVAPADYVFTEKKRAEKALVLLVEAEKKKLESFNAEHGTSHAYPFSLEKKNEKN